MFANKTDGIDPSKDIIYVQGMSEAGFIMTAGNAPAGSLCNIKADYSWFHHCIINNLSVLSIAFLKENGGGWREKEKIVCLFILLESKIKGDPSVWLQD